MNQGSEQVSGRGVGEDLEGDVGEAVPVERGCEGIGVGQTRWAAQFCWRWGEGLEHMLQGY